MAFLTTALPQLPLLSFLLPLIKVLLVSSSVLLMCFFVKGEILQNMMFPEHYDLWEPPRDNGENVRLGLTDNRKQIPGSQKRLVVLFVESDHEQLVQ